MKNAAEQRNSRAQWGQSLTEVALVLPIILLIIAGLVEISNLIVSQSKLDAAVRKAARFGAQGGIDEGMRISMLQAVTPTLDLDPTFWDVYVIRATVNDTGSGYVPGSWSMDPLYGLQNTRPVASINQGEVQGEILANLNQQDAGSALAANYQIVGMMAFHNVDSILGLDNFIRGLNTVRAFSVMRITPVPTARMTNGCQAFPIAVEAGARSLNTVTDFPLPPSFEFPTEADEIPLLSDFYYGSNLPAPRSMLNAGSGYIFVIPFNGASAGDTAAAPGTFDFTRWDWFNVINMQTALATSLTWPGNTRAACANPAGGDPGWEHPILGCGIDNDLQNGDPVRVSTANVDTNAIKDQLDEHIDRSRTMRIMLFDRDDPPPPAAGYGYSADQMRKVSNFAIARPLGYNLEAGQPNWILFQFVGLDASCGVSLEGGITPTATPTP